MGRSEGTRTVKVMADYGLVAKTTFHLTSDEWVLIRPALAKGSICGNTLIVDAGTDIDSVVVKWDDEEVYN